MAAIACCLHSARRERYINLMYIKETKDECLTFVFRLFSC